MNDDGTKEEQEFLDGDIQDDVQGEPSDIGRMRLSALVIELGGLRKDLPDYKEKVRAAKEVLEETEAFRSLARFKGTLKGQENAINECCDRIKELALELAIELKDKDLNEFVEVRRQTVFKITDMQAALKWAKVKAPLLVNEVLDAKMFEVNIMAMDEEQRLGVPGFEIYENEYGQARILTKALDAAQKE